MSDPRLVIDDDAFVLLAAAGQLDRCVELLGFSVGQVRRLPALPHILARSLEGKTRSFREYTAEHRRQAAGEAERVEGIQLRPTDDEVSQLLAPAIQFDAPLYATVAESSVTWLHSADVSAMRRVCGNPEFEPVTAAMRGRVVSAESLVYRFVDVEGYPAAAAAFGPVLYASKTLKCVFPATPNPDDPLESARSYLRGLCSELGRGFLHCPPCHDYRTTGVCRLETPP